MIVRKTTKTEWYYQSTMLSNQSIKIKIWFINCKINCLSMRFYSANRTISLIVFLSSVRHIFSIIARVKNYLFIHLLSIARTFSLQFEKCFELHAFVNQIKTFFSISFRKVFRFARIINIYLFIYLFDNFFNDYTNILFITVRKKFWIIRVRQSN